MRTLKDKVAVVTGGGAGIGRAIAIELAREGMDVALADVDRAALAETAGAIEAMGRRARSFPTDVRDPDAVEALLDKTVSELGGCHVAVNNAGVFHAATLLEAPLSEWRRVIDTNLWGVIHGCRVFGTHFSKQREGHIVNTASAAGLFPMPGMSSYTTTKFAIVGLSEQLRWELAESGVGVTVLCPGVVRTGISNRAGTGLSHIDMDAATRRAPLPDGLAKKTVRAVRRNRPMVRYGADSYLFSFLRLLPLVFVDPLGRFMAKASRNVLHPLPPASKP